MAETNGKVTTLKLNLASLKSIRSAVEELKQRHSHIHLLINNAGTWFILRTLFSNFKKIVQES